MRSAMAVWAVFQPPKGRENSLGQGAFQRYLPGGLAVGGRPDPLAQDALFGRLKDCPHRHGHRAGAQPDQLKGRDIRLDQLYVKHEKQAKGGDSRPLPER